MRSHAVFCLLICLTVLVFTGLVSAKVSVPKASDVNGIVHPPFPYMAEITSDNVYIRSGPGTNYYSCGKLNMKDKVKIVGSQFSWSRIVPPKGSFSWISKQYVSADLGKSSVGVVDGDEVHVYAGSEDVKPIHSTVLQVQLNSSDKVEILDAKETDYYKIVPPDGVYLWISTPYTKPAGMPDQTKPADMPDRDKHAAPVAGPKAAVKVVSDSNSAAAAVPQSPVSSAGTGNLGIYRELEQQISLEQAKPPMEQDYTQIKKSLAELAGDKTDPKAARYAELSLARVARFELVVSVSKELQLQDEQLRQIKERVDKARDEKLTQVANLDKYVIMGQLRSSDVYGSETESKRYRIADGSDKTIGYAIPVGKAAAGGWDKLLDKYVGLVGTLEPDSQTALVIVKFTEADEIAPPQKQQEPQQEAEQKKQPVPTEQLEPQQKTEQKEQPEKTEQQEQPKNTVQKEPLMEDGENGEK